jgi:DNA-binding transcriptional LysR family regulator
MPRTLSQRGLQAFRLTVVTGGVSAAATAMNISQPAASRLLRDLEAEIGFDLFLRVKGRLQPSAEGLAFFEEVQRSFVGLDRLLTAARDIGRGRKSTITVGAMPAVTAALLPRLVRLFMQSQPGATMALRAGTSTRISQLVLSGACDLALVSVAVPRKGLVFEREYSLPCLCVLPVDHRLCACPEIGIDDLRDERLIRHAAADSLIGMQVDLLLEQHGVSICDSVEVEISSVISDLVLEGLGIGIVDAITAASHVAKGGVARPFRPFIKFGVGVVRLVNSVPNAAQRAFLAACDACMADTST